MKPTTQEIVTIDTSAVGCDGGNGSHGHPRVFLKMDASRQVECPYCGRLFKLQDGVPLDGGH